MPWKKVTPGEGRGSITGREPRTTFAVRRNRSGGVATLVIPAQHVNGATRADIYRDGTRLAFALGNRGGYALIAPGPKSKARSVTIPAAIGKSIPYGTRDVTVDFDGDMIVVDFAQIAPIALAAE